VLPAMTVRVFAGWDFEPDDIHRLDFAHLGYTRGVPMGGDLHAAPAGNTVNVEEASFTNTIGDPVLFAHWQDPDFDPPERAFYYVRVLEIPTPRWTTYDAAFFGVELPQDVPAWQQERAYTSAIWYTP